MSCKGPSSTSLNNLLLIYAPPLGRVEYLIRPAQIADTPFSKGLYTTLAKLETMSIYMYIYGS
jgi:hypothetical protein